MREREQAVAERAGVPARPDARAKPAQAKPTKLSFNEKRELDAMPDRITALESEQAGLHQRLADPALYQQDPDEAVRIKARLDTLEAEIEAAMARWEALEAKLGTG
jgi:ATP-binding cassette subfamily F protein uup